MAYDYGEENNQNLKLLVVLGRTIQGLQRRLAPGIRETGLTPAQFGALEALYHQGPLAVNEVIEKMLSSSGNIAVVVNNLVKAGLAEKVTGRADKRVHRVSLTPEGRELIGRFLPRHMETLVETTTALIMEEKEKLIRLLKKLRKYF
jgi:DNA-binding MarR family transcriptional regulator